MLWEMSDQCKAAVSRILCDLIDADGIIEDEEIRMLDSLKKKYGLTQEHIREGYYLSSSHAFGIIKASFDESERAVLMQDLKEMAVCDGTRALAEVHYLGLLSLCLDPGVNAEPISFAECDMRFSKSEAIYLDKSDDERHHDILDKERSYLCCLFAAVGYRLIHIPWIVNLFESKWREPLYSDGEDDSPLILPILMFSEPMTLSNELTAQKFSDDMSTVTTSRFTNDFTPSKFVNWPDPCFLFKLKSSRVFKRAVKKQSNAAIPLSLEKYTDFVAVPVSDNISYTVQRIVTTMTSFSDNYLAVSNPLPANKLYSKGFHKTLMDYVLRLPERGTVTRMVVTIDKRRKRKAKHMIEFEGCDTVIVDIPGKTLALYLLMAAYSLEKDNDGMLCGMTLGKVFKKIYEKTGYKCNTDYRTSRDTLVKDLRLMLNKHPELPDRNLFYPIKKGDFYFINYSPSLIFVREDYTEKPIELKDWLRLLSIP